MSVPVDSVRGHAVFGTSSGLVVRGDGILAGADREVSIFEFETGRARDGPFHGSTLGVPGRPRPAVFFRRVGNGMGDTANLLGMVSPCIDAHGRRGFMGAGLALALDRRGRCPGFCDWGACIDQVTRLFEIVESRIDQETGRLQSVPELAASRATSSPDGAQALGWEAGSGPPLYLDGSGCGDDMATILQGLQALAFVHGAQYPTQVVFRFPVGNSLPMDDEFVRAAVGRFRDARSMPPGAGGGSPVGNSLPMGGEPARAAAGIPSGPCGGPEATWEEIGRLREEIGRLREGLRDLEDRFSRGGASRHGARLHLETSARRDGEGVTALWKVLFWGVCALLVLILTAAFFRMIPGL